MTDTIDLDDIEPFPEAPDFKRSNGAPLVIVDGRKERYSRPSSYGKMLDDDSALVLWRINKAIAGMARSPDLVARAAAAKDDDRPAWQKLRDDAIAAGRGAESADIGTALHAMSCRYEDPDDDFDPPEPFATSLKAYGAGLERYGLESVQFEFATVCREYRTAGTCDRLYRLTRPLIAPTGEILPTGTLVIGDLKTGSKLEFGLPSYTVQMALYSQGEFYDVTTDEFIETPTINQDWAILVHLPAAEPGRCEFLWVNLEIGNQGAWLTAEIKQWRYNWRSGKYAAPEIGNPPPQPEGVVAMLRENLGARETDTLAWIKQRVGAFKDDPKAAVRLGQKWELPPPKMLEPEHFAAALGLLDQLEAEFQLPFIPAPVLP